MDGRRSLQRPRVLRVDALAKVSGANSHLDAGRFDLAAKNYSETLSLFNQLEISRPDRLRNALRTGKEALERLDDETAQTRFGIALSLDPGNSPAMHGLKRARNLRQVIDRIQQGQAFESNGEFAQAKRAYAEAIALRPVCRGTEGDHVHIQLQDLWLGEMILQLGREDRFTELPQHGPFRRQPEVLGELLRNGGGSSEWNIPPDRLSRSRHHLAPCEPVMGEEVDILCHQDGPEQVRRHLIHGYPGPIDLGPSDIARDGPAGHRTGMGVAQARHVRPAVPPRGDGYASELG